MVFSARFAALALASAAVVSSATATNTYAYEEETPCYADGERAIGAPGYPAVDYLPCCSGQPPRPMDTSAYSYDATKSWGQFCGGTGKVVVGEMCYKDGERAIGAPGYEAVEYMPCCNGMEPKSMAYDWGKFCGGEAPKPTAEPKEYDESYTRCAGEEGYPYVEYVNCGSGYKCEKMPSYSWGFFCVPTTKSDCYGPGERAIGAEGYPAISYMPCCDGKEPMRMAYNWGLFCPGAYSGPAVTSAPPAPPAPKCVKAGMKCDAYGSKCCYGTDCSASGYGYSVCEAAPPAPKCVKAGMKCDAYGSKCCNGTDCSASGYGYSVCEAAPAATPAPTCVLGGETCKMYGMMCCDGFECVSSGGYNPSLSCVAVATDAPTTTTTTVMPSPEDY